MPIFKLSKNKLEPIQEERIDLERHIQKITEQNLETIFGLKFVCGATNQEFCVRVNEQDFYIDTFAYDESSKSIVLIEYKKDKSFSVIDQGFAYLAAMLNNKAEFILEINERLNKRLTKKDIDWEQSRIIFISNEFTNYQRNAINFKDLPMFLYEVKTYKSGILDYNPIKPYRTSESIKKFIKDKNVQKVAKEVKVYTLEDLIKPNWDQTKELLTQLEYKLMKLNYGIRIKYTKCYIAYVSKHGRNFIEIVPRKQGLKIYYRFPADSIQSNLKITDCSKVGHWTNGISSVHLMDASQINEAVRLANQSFKYLHRDIYK